MSESTKAVFLSYAREDADAAKRIAEALRASGLEVWFDQNELRGGEAWDAKIRKQIDACALFIPLISVHTQERNKGYFRLEWKLAVDETHLLAAGVPFIAPVVVDDTKESGALVPPEFMKVQWTRLPGALPTPEFVTQVKRLLAAGSGAAPGASPAQAPAAGATPKKAFSLALIAAAVASVAVVGALIWFAVGRDQSVPATAKSPVAAATPAPAATVKAPRVADKSIAVLPFTNMSEDKDNAFFADGVHEDVLTNLALIRELRVVSRTSVQTYRGTTKSMKQIAEELGVTYILEGSVRRVGNKVRVTGQLIHAATDEHVWAQTYDRDLTDIFAIQSELSQQIAGALKTALSPEEKVFIERAPTANPAAYDAYQKGRDIRNRAPTANPTALAESEQYFQHAVDLDPTFAAAWAQLAVVHALKVFWESDTSAERKAKGDAAIARAMQLAPDAPEVIRLVGTYAYYAYRDYARATAAYERILRLQPNDPTAYGSLSLIQRRQGRWAESLATQRRAIELDPGNVAYVRALISTLHYLRRWDEAQVVRARLLQLLPGELREQLAAANEDWRITGSEAKLHEQLARLTPEQREIPLVRAWRKTVALNRDDFPEFKRLYELQPVYEDLEPLGFSRIGAAVMYQAHGDPAAGRREAERLREEMKATLATQPENLRAQMWLGMAEAFLGNRSSAATLAQHILATMPESRDALDAPNFRYGVMEIYALMAEKDESLAQLTQLLQGPFGFTMHDLRADPCLRALWDDPRFQALTKQLNNKAPLL